MVGCWKGGEGFTSALGGEYPYEYEYGVGWRRWAEMGGDGRDGDGLLWACCGRARDRMKALALPGDLQWLFCTNTVVVESVESVEVR